jgi:hypothetical protein
MIRHVGFALACLSIAASLFLTSAAEDVQANTKTVTFNNFNTSATVASLVKDSLCSADVSGNWSGVLAFQGKERRDRVIDEQIQEPSSIGPMTTTQNGTFVWRVSGNEDCQVAMVSHRVGSAKVVLAALRVPPTIVAQAGTPTPGFIPWYYISPSPWPTPVASAFAAIGGAFGAAYIYNSGTNPLNTASPGSNFINNTTGCYFLCYGTPGQSAHHVLVYGNDVTSTSYTSQGAPDDCDRPMFHHCPGGVFDQVFSITVTASGVPNLGYFAAMDGNADWGVFGNLRAGGAVIAGTGVTMPEPSPIPSGALVSYGGSGKGYLLLGSSADYLTCDYGVATAGALTCNKPLIIASPSGGIRPNGSSGGYAPEVFPNGLPTSHPTMVSGSCLVSGPTLCTFPNSFSFPDTGYNCTATAQGSSQPGSSYVKSNATQITLYSTSVSGITYSYICIE